VIQSSGYVPRINTSLFLLNKEYDVVIKMEAGNSDTTVRCRTATLRSIAESPISRLKVIDMMIEQRSTGGECGNLERKNIERRFTQDR
jgi:hypothetical protein